MVSPVQIGTSYIVTRENGTTNPTGNNCTPNCNDTSDSKNCKYLSI